MTPDECWTGRVVEYIHTKEFGVVHRTGTLPRGDAIFVRYFNVKGTLLEHTAKLTRAKDLRPARVQSLACVPPQPMP